MKVELIEVMGSDLTVVNAARVSMDKHHTAFTVGDARLIKYLADHDHWTPCLHIAKRNLELRHLYLFQIS